MRIFSNFCILVLGMIIVSCSETEIDDSKEQMSERHEFSAPIDTTIKNADAIFTFSNIPKVETGFVDRGRLYWYIDDGIVLNDDVQREITLCDDSRFLICIISPTPILVPKNFINGTVFKINDSTFSLNIEEYFSGKNACDFSVVEFTITNDKSVNHQYVISKREGLLYFSLKDPDGLLDGELFRVSGNVFSYEEFCE